MLSSTLFKALADPTRLRIVSLLDSMELTISELAHVLMQSQPRVSRHVGILEAVGLVTRQREGSWAYLTLQRGLVAENLFRILRHLDDPAEQAAAAEDLARLDVVREERNQAAAAYFEAHAEEWDALRALHVADDSVEDMLRSMIDSSVEHLVDIGTGTGRMLTLFGERCERFTGIDRSSEMLRVARGKTGDRPNAHFLQGDALRLPLPDSCADVAIMHHVLHFLADPAPAIAEAARILRPGGRLIVVDFAAHDREELRTRYQHVRLGLGRTEMDSWFAAARLTPRPVWMLSEGRLAVEIWDARRGDWERF